VSGPNIFESLEEVEIFLYRIAFKTKSVIAFLLAGVSFVSAKDVGHIEPESRFADSSKPRVEYLDFHLPAF
jgi:hypothetical protein